MDAARLNFSHGDHQTHLEYIYNIRNASHATGKSITVIQDLSGPKLRIGLIEGGEVQIVEGEQICISSAEVLGNKDIISTSYPGMINDVRTGEALLIDDGKLRLEITGIDIANGLMHCEVKTGGMLKSRKGLNLPHTKLSLPSLTEKDISDIDFGVQHGIDMTAMSFVRSEEDIYALRDLLRSKGSHAQVIAKIERPEAVQSIDRIIDAADLIMVARGDMGVEISAEDVPVIQKMIIRKCNEKIKPVITATQMLESMITNPTPTRAEASDVANAILDGTDCVMLSAETSTGSYPVTAVHTMSKIIRKTETIQKTKYFGEIFIEDSPENTLHTICNSAVEIATRVNARAIVTITHTGSSPLILSNHRPGALIIAATGSDEIIRKCNLVWGVEPVKIEESRGLIETVRLLRRRLTESGFSKGDRVVFISSMPFTKSDSANMIQVTKI